MGLIFQNGTFFRSQKEFLHFGRRRVALQGQMTEDPKYPVENLLTPDSQRGPWLSCPQDKSGQLKVELQLERAVPISYIDVDDFLAPASGESWDRLRLTCSQPFTRHQPFGLAFLRVRSSLDALGDPEMCPSTAISFGPSQGSSDDQESGPSPWLANPSIRRTFFPDPPTNSKEVSELKDFLKQLQPGALGRSARMLLSAARKAPSASLANRKNNHTDAGARQPEGTEPRAEEQNSENDGGRKKRQRVQDQSAEDCTHSPRHCRSPASSNSQSKRRGTPIARHRAHRPQSQSNGVQDRGQCPICAGSFSAEILPLHAATCGEPSPPHAAPPSSSPSSSPSVLWVSSPESSPPASWIQCPICQVHFAASEVEEHASVCGEALQG
ncbi:protein XNDC1N isoform X5 [Cavia porcellus]|uniref:protein XNDC1N isoform X5 n=1 Tax=Cavia porcellus TaxID=10141 RepID=UPI002FE1A3E2